MTWLVYAGISAVAAAATAILIHDAAGPRKRRYASFASST